MVAEAFYVDALREAGQFANCKDDSFLIVPVDSAQLFFSFSRPLD
jgi:hypothetical protein